MLTELLNHFSPKYQGKMNSSRVIVYCALILTLIYATQTAVNNKKQHGENSVDDVSEEDEPTTVKPRRGGHHREKNRHHKKTNGSEITQAQILALIKAIESNQILKSLPAGIFEKEKKKRYRNIWERFFKPQHQPKHTKGKDDPESEGEGEDKVKVDSDESKEELKLITEKPKHYVVDGATEGPGVEVEDGEGQKRRSAKISDDDSAFEKWYKHREWLRPGSVMDVTTKAPVSRLPIKTEDDPTLGQVPDVNSCDVYALTSDQIEKLKSQGKPITPPLHIGKLPDISEILPKFKEYKKRLQTLLARLAPQCPEIDPHALLTDWMKLFHKAFPNFDTLTDKSKKYVDDLKAKLEKCYERLVKANFGIGRSGKDPKIVEDLELDLLDAIKVKRSYDTHDGLLARSFRSELMDPILRYYQPGTNQHLTFRGLSLPYSEYFNIAQGSGFNDHLENVNFPQQF